MSKIPPNNAYAGSSTTLAKHHLAQISHYFLSDINEYPPVWKNTTIIPVLLGSRNDDYIAYELSHAFNCQNRSSMVLKIESCLTVSNDFSVLANNIMPTLVTHNDDEKINFPDYCLIPASSPSPTLILKSDCLLIAVQASLSGVRIAYARLALIASLNAGFTIYVVILGAQTQTVAKRFFGFLYKNAQALLSLKLECGGYLLHNNNPIDGVKNVETENEEIATDLNSIAGNLLRQISSHSKGKSVAHLATPLQPTILPG
ncbi:MAG: hypothetical protein L3J84_09580 [Gammaproteobacteria bacterium]|nr:hypothetical protein [Gammaproteobacteria bacterium]